MGQDLKKNSKFGLLSALAVIAVIIITVAMTPIVKNWLQSPTIIEKTISEVNTLSLDSNAVTYTYFVDIKTPENPVFVGNSVGYPINPATGKILEGAIVNIIDKDGLRYPTWRSLDGTMIVSPMKLHHNGLTDSGEQIPVSRFDTIVQQDPGQASTTVQIVPKK